MSLLKAAALGATGAALAILVWPREHAEALRPAFGTPANLIAAGDTLLAGDLHQVRHPGKYGLGPHLSGSPYGIVAGHLVRYDAATLQVHSVLRRQDRLPD